MTAMTPHFVLITENAFMRLPRQRQRDLLYEARDHCDTPLEDADRNATARWAYVDGARQAFWENKAAGMPQRPARTRSKIITATECNEWLRSLPPIPID